MNLKVDAVFFTVVMEVDMLSLRPESSLHQDSETRQSEPLNPPADNGKIDERWEEQNQKEVNGFQHNS